MKKYISLLMLPVFLVAVIIFQEKTTEHAFADIPLRPCKIGSMILSYADGSTADAYVDVFAPILPGDPIPRGIDPALDADVERWERRNGFVRPGCPLCAIPLKMTNTAYASSYTAANLSEIVKKEGGGGPYCYNAGNGSIQEGLSDQNCSSRFPGTVFAGFKVESVHRTYMCGTPSPWTDG